MLNQDVSVVRELHDLIASSPDLTGVPPSPRRLDAIQQLRQGIEQQRNAIRRIILGAVPQAHLPPACVPARRVCNGIESTPVENLLGCHDLCGACRYEALWVLRICEQVLKGEKPEPFLSDALLVERKRQGSIVQEQHNYRLRQSDAATDSFMEDIRQFLERGRSPSESASSTAGADVEGADDLMRSLRERALDSEQCRRVIAAHEALCGDPRQWIPRRELESQFRVPPKTVDKDALAPNRKKFRRGAADGPKEFCREYLIDFVERRWKPRVK